MPIPKPHKGEKKDEFISRCMGDSVMVKEYEQDVRAGICYDAYDRRNRNMQHTEIVVLSSYQIQRKMFENRPHIVAPVVLLTVGVHHGSGGPLYYPEEELRKFPVAWNGVPVPVLHPFNDDGEPISCNSPEVIEKVAIGRLFNVVFDEKLKGEIWIDEQKARSIAPGVLADLLCGKHIEVSTGLFSEDEVAIGEWNGERYEFIARNIRPDHLALLPGQVGACSVADGCGVRANTEEGEGNMPESVVNKLPDSRLKLFVNEVSHGEVHQALQKEVNKLDKIPANEGDAYVFNYVESVFEDYFVYAQESPEGVKLFRQEYAIENNGAIKLSEEVKQVRKDVNYVVLQKNTNDKEVKIMAESTFKPCCPQKVQELIANTENPFTETDRPWLETLSEEALGAISGIKFHAAPPEAPKTVEEAITSVPEQFRAELEAGVKIQRDQKDATIKSITANSINQFTEDELKAKSMDELNKISAMLRTPDYSANGGADKDLHNNVMSGDAGEVLELPVLEIPSKK